MNKIIIAGIFTMLMLLVPLNSIVDADIVSPNKNDNNRLAKVLITNVEYNKIKNYVESIDDNEIQSDAISIFNKVISDQGEVFVGVLGQVINQYEYEGMPPEPQLANPIQGLIDMIIEAIQGRLGWVYDCFNHVTTLIQDARFLISDITIPSLIIAEIQEIIEQLVWIKDLTILLISCKFYHIFAKWELRIEIIKEILALISNIQLIMSQIGTVINDVVTFINDVDSFIQWFNSEPWTGKIRVYGQVLEGLTGIANVDVYCWGVSVKTDEEGYFDFYVDSDNNSDKSLPPNQWYGLHCRIVSVEKDGEIVKETAKELSYVFSDGALYWIFSIKDENPEQKNSQIMRSNPLYLQFRKIILDLYERLINKNYLCYLNN